MQRLIACERVSTAGQGKSGLGLAAQRAAIDAFAYSRGTEVTARFTEVESGRRNDWPELAKALNLANLTGAKLVITKFDRASRNADAHAAALAPLIGELQCQEHTCLRAVARELNARKMRTRRGGKRHVSTVKKLLKRIGNFKEYHPHSGSHIRSQQPVEVSG